MKRDPRTFAVLCATVLVVFGAFSACATIVGDFDFHGTGGSASSSTTSTSGMGGGTTTSASASSSSSGMGGTGGGTGTGGGPPNGQACMMPADCGSGHCVDGVCCDSECTLACKACSAAKKGAGADGVCGNVAVDSDPNMGCAPYQCSGLGGCLTKCATVKDCASSSYCLATACVPKKAAGVACTTAMQCASGACLDGFCCGTPSCPACQACTGAGGTCVNVAAGMVHAMDCPAGKQCNGMGMCALAIGQVCTMTSQCANGPCVDGYCCNAACAGTCQACNVAGKLGTCSNIPVGQPDNNPPNACTGTMACNGNGACLKASGQPCVIAAQCASGICILNNHCQ